MSEDRALYEGEVLSGIERTAGWELLCQHLQSQIDSKLKKLEETDFTDLAQVTKIQGEIAGLRRPQIFLQDRLRRYGRALQKEEK